MSRYGRVIDLNAPKTQVAVDVVQEAPKPAVVDTYLALRREHIIKALQAAKYDELMQPTEIEIDYVMSVYEAKGFTDLDSVQPKDVSEIGKRELEVLNERMKDFTKKMSGVDSTGIFELIDDLSTEVGKSDLGEIWNKAVNAKPSLLARMLSIVYPSAIKKSILNRFDSLTQLLQSRGKSLESKLETIEVELRKQREKQLQNINMLDKCFQVYYDAFIQLRKQFMFCFFVEYNFEKQLAKFKEVNANSTDLMVGNKLNEYERILSELQNRRLLLLKTLLQLPITSDQNSRLIGVSRHLMNEINNTLLASMPVIRMNMVGVKAAIDAERAFLCNTSARSLEENSSRLMAQMTTELGVKAELMSGDARLQEARRMAELVQNLGEFKDRLTEAKEKSKKDIDEASEILYNVTHDLKEILNQN